VWRWVSALLPENGVIANLPPMWLEHVDSADKPTLPAQRDNFRIARHSEGMGALSMGILEQYVLLLAYRQ
jgi:hypothetical protein